MAGTSKRSSFFIGSLVAAIATTVVLLSLLVLQETTKPPPQPGSSGGPGGGGRPPSPLLNPQNLTATIVVVAAVFTIAWVATIAATMRDQIMNETRRLVSDYGEMKETEGYVEGYSQGGRPGGEVHQLRRVPPID